MSGLVAEGVIELHVHGHEQNLWSPQLIVDVVEDAGKEETLLRGRFGPHPSVWTMYLAGFAVLSAVGLMSGVFGLAQWTMGEAPSAMWGMPAALVLGLLLYFGAFLGQGLSEQEMEKLVEFLRVSMAPDEPFADQSSDT